MADAALNDVDAMRDAVFFDGPDIGRRRSRFWILLLLASIIAAAGVVADSTATVIGAMIVAPLMTPILGTMLAVVLADRTNLIRSAALVVAGALASILIGYAMGRFVANPVTAASNGQVAARISPHLIDLVAALATGVVGAVALVRRDISDTLPGVAIAISLVPPLAVVGLTAEAGAYSQSLGALLLFAANVAAILTTGIIVMAVYRVRSRSTPATGERVIHRRAAMWLIICFFVVVSIPLTVSTVKIARQQTREAVVRRVADSWAAGIGWDVVGVTSTQEGTVVLLAGLPPLPDTAGLADALRQAGVDPSHVIVDFFPRAKLVVGSP